MDESKNKTIIVGKYIAKITNDIPEINNPKHVFRLDLSRFTSLKGANRFYDFIKKYPPKLIICHHDENKLIMIY